MQKLILAHRSKYWNDLIETAANNNIWKRPGIGKYKHSHIPSFSTDATSTQTNAEILALCYERQFSPHFPPPLQSAETCKRTYGDITNQILTSTDYVSGLLKRLKKQSPRPRRHPKSRADTITSPNDITDIYNAAFHFRHFPSPWKTAKIIPTHKPGKSKNFPAAYRSISLLNTLNKILENLILDKILGHINEKDLANRDRGFRENHSTTQQLFKTTDTVLEPSSF